MENNNNNKSGCVNCKWKGLPVADPSKRCRHPKMGDLDIETIAIVGGYPCTCSEWEKNDGQR